MEDNIEKKVLESESKPTISDLNSRSVSDGNFLVHKKDPLKRKPEKDIENLEEQLKKARETKIYPYDLILAINNPDLSNLDLTLCGFFSSLPLYNITKEMRFHFPNRNNIHFNKKRTRPKSVISEDPEVLKSLRSCLSKITEQNFDTMVSRITDILNGKDYDWNDVSRHVYLSVIDNIFLAPIFVNLLVKLEPKFPKLIHHLHRMIQKQIFEPEEFKDTISESGQNKTKRWQISNALLVSELYIQKCYSPNFIIKKIEYWLNKATIDNTIPLEILIKIIPKLKDLNIPSEVNSKLKEISEDKTYPTRLRLLLTLPKKK
tara:strand:+ start:10891 stop:11844 length:954 start_codon:yes stop_codon:yes gene_type:complete